MFRGPPSTGSETLGKGAPPPALWLTMPHGMLAGSQSWGRKERTVPCRCRGALTCRLDLGAHRELRSWCRVPATHPHRICRVALRPGPQTPLPGIRAPREASTSGHEVTCKVSAKVWPHLSRCGAPAGPLWGLCGLAHAVAAVPRPERAVQCGRFARC